MTRTRRRGIAVALGLGLAATVAPAAVAAPDAGRVEVSVAGDPQATTLFGDVVVVPGHSQTRSLQVANVGDLPGTLTVEVVDATLTGAPAAFFDHLTINGVSATELDGVATAITPGRTLAAGEVVTVPVELAFDVENAQPDLDRSFSFAVRATLTGETPDAEVVAPTPAPKADDDADAGSPVETETTAEVKTDAEAKAETGARTETGGILAMDRTGLLWAAGALLAGGLAALIPITRARRGRHSA